MKCPHCNKEIKDNLRFCSFCGEKLSDSNSSTPASSKQDEPEWKKYRESSGQAHQQSAIATPTRNTETTDSEFNIKRTVNEIGNTLNKKLDNVKYNHNKLPNNIVPEIIHPCDGENPVKQYNFMEMKFPLFKYWANGLLQITNKRIVYTLLSNSCFGYDRMQSEFAIDDVASVTVGKTTSFNFLYPLLYLLISPTLLFTLGLIGHINQYFSLVLAIIGAVAVFFLSRTKHFNWLHILSAGLGYTCLMSIISSMGDMDELLLNMLMGYDAEFNFVGFILIIFYIYFLIMNIISYFRSIIHTNINVTVTSKSGVATPITCNQNGFLSVSHNLLQSLCIIEPTEDTDVMASELGAMISDIQKLGDYGIEKWRNK